MKKKTQDKTKAAPGTSTKAGEKSASGPKKDRKR